jgi:hypothetical protein
MLSEGLYGAIIADTGVQGSVGTPTTRSDNTTGVFPVFAPDALPMPYIVYQQISGEPTTTSFEGTNRLQTSRWRFSCYGSTYKQTRKLAKALKTVLLALDGVLGASNACVNGAWQLLEADEAEPVPHGTIYTVHLDFEILYLDNE